MGLVFVTPFARSAADGLRRRPPRPRAVLAVILTTTRAGCPIWLMNPAVAGASLSLQVEPFKEDASMRPVTLAAAMCAALTISTAARSQQEGIVVADAWARPSATPATPSAAYFVVTDHGPADRLVSVSTPVSGNAQIHETLQENGVMKMRSVQRLPLEPGKPVAFAPGSYHVMLMELKQPLQAGDSFPLTLTFEKAAPVTVQVKVMAKGPGTGIGTP